MQCQYITSHGQCRKDALDGLKWCEAHLPASVKNNKSTSLGQYQIACKLLGDAPERHAATNAELKSLRGEIALMRAMLERRLNMIESDAELVAAMPTLKDFALAVEKLASSCHNMDVKLGNLLDKQALMSLAQEIIQIITRRTSPLRASQGDVIIDETIEAIGQDIVEAIAKQENKNAR